MASGKRASMREGPLAALFRATEEEGVEAPAKETAREPVERERPTRPSAGAACARARAVGIGAVHARGSRAAPRAAPARVPPERSSGRHRATRACPRPRSACARCSAPTSRRTSWSAPASVRPRADQEPIHQAESPLHREPVLRVIGVGGAGVNAVDRMIEAQVQGVEFIAVNTDVQSLEQSSAPTRVHIGSDSTRGLGAGAEPELGRRRPWSSTTSSRACSRARTWCSSPPAPVAARERARHRWWRGSPARSAR